MFDVVMCEAVTKKSVPCSIGANPGSLLCHVHDPNTQCGFIKKDGKPCAIATGGVRCKYHKADRPAGKKSRRRRMPKAAPVQREAHERRIMDSMAFLDQVAQR